MRFKAKSGVAVLLALILSLGALPATVLAADGEMVLETIDHSAAVGAVSVHGKTDATLTVPYTYPGDVDLSTGLDVTYDTSIYSSVVPSFPGGATAVVGGAAVDMVVNYQRKSDATLYATDYTVSVARAAYVAPTFSGTVTKSVTMSHSLTFAATDFTAKYAKHDGGDLSSIAITGSNPSFGTLRLGSAEYNFGDPVTVADLSAGRLTFAATDGGTVSYIVEAFAADKPLDPVGSVVLTINAARVAPTFTGTVSKALTLPATTATFTSGDFTGKYTKNDGGDMASVAITGSNPSFGKLRLGSVDYSAGTAVTLSDISSGKLTFVATGVGTVSYTVRAYASGDASTSIGSVTLTISVQNPTAETITYTATSGTPAVFDDSDFNDVCQNLTDENLSYVKFSLPSSSYGRLYYDYTSSGDYGSTVSSSTKYYRTSSPYLSEVSFVPDVDYAGNVTINYTAYNVDGESFTGSIKVVVKEYLGADDIDYATGENTAVTFDASDFNSACDDLTNETLSYVKFSLPSSSYGKLYYNYISSSDLGTAVSSSTKYYRSSSSSSLSKVTFVPKTGRTGEITIDYTGYSTDGESYTGRVIVAIQAVAADITYNTNEDAAVTFNASDFNSACDDATSETLSYVKFKLPSTTYGKLYYNYSSSSSTGSSVSASTKYYRNSSSYLSRVTFVPKTGYAGTVSITYTGYDVDGEVYTGAVKIVVKEKDAGSQYFTDVGTTYSWASEAIDYLYKGGVVTGMSTGRYSPATDITRADFIVMLVRGFDLQAGVAGNFGDVPVGTYYFNSIAVAKALGIAQGDGGYFRPAFSLSRQDAMVLVARALGVTSVTLSPGTKSNLSGFSDSGEVSDYAVGAVATLVKAGVIKGTNGKINPKGSITRAEMAVILYRVLTIQ